MFFTQVVVFLGQMTKDMQGGSVIVSKIDTAASRKSQLWIKYVKTACCNHDVLKCFVLGCCRHSLVVLKHVEKYVLVSSNLFFLAFRCL